MLESFGGGFPATGSTLNKTFHHKEWLINFFYCAGIFTYCRCYSCYAYRTAIEFMDDRRENAVIHFIEAIFIYTQGVHSMNCDFFIYRTVAFDLRKIPDSSK